MGGAAMSTRVHREQWRNTPIASRLQFLNELYAPFPALTRAVHGIQKRIAHANLTKRGSGMLVVMPTGAGKTRLAQHFAEILPDIEEAERTVRRVVYMRVPSVCTPSSFAKSLLLALGDPLPEKGNAHQRTQRASELLDKCGTQLFIVDNAHDVADGKTNLTSQSIACWLRDVIDSTSAVVLLLGTKLAMGLVNGNAQLARRMSANFRVDYFDVHQKQGRATFYRFLKEVDDRLPLAEPSLLADGKLGAQLAMATDGMNAELIALLSFSIEEAQKEGREHLDRADLARAFELRHGQLPEGCNPFSDDFVYRSFAQDFHPFASFKEDANAAGPTKN